MDDSRHVVISVSARGLLVVGAALVLGWALVSAATAVLVILSSAFAALVLDPPVTKLAASTGMSRGRAALLVVLGVVVVGLLVTLALLIPMLRELRDLIQARREVVAAVLLYLAAGDIGRPLTAAGASRARYVPPIAIGGVCLLVWQRLGDAVSAPPSDSSA